MSVEKAYLVVVARNGSNVMLVGRFADQKLAQEVADGQPDGSGYVLTAFDNIDPALAGGLEAEVRHEAEQLEGKDRSTFLRPKSPGVTEDEARRTQEEEKRTAEATEKAARDLKSSDKVVDRAAAKTENRTTVPDSAKTQDQKKR